MRHDAHYVDTLAASAAPPVGRIVPIDRVDPNPDQPRQAMGDLCKANLDAWFRTGKVLTLIPELA